MRDPATETLHTYQPSESDLQKGWRLGVAAAWSLLKSFEAERGERAGIIAALAVIEGLGNAGPPKNLKLRSSTCAAKPPARRPS
jgi:hypothetical protein